MTWENIEARCEAGFDGGHQPVYVLEVYMLPSPDNGLAVNGGGNVLIYNISSADGPHFEMAGLTPGTTYQFAAFVYNLKGQSPKILFNVTTLNLAEKRTAETRYYKPK